MRNKLAGLARYITTLKRIIAPIKYLRVQQERKNIELLRTALQIITRPVIHMSLAVEGQRLGHRSYTAYWANFKGVGPMTYLYSHPAHGCLL